VRVLAHRVPVHMNHAIASNVMIYMGTKSMTLFDRKGISPSCTGTHESPNRTIARDDGLVHMWLFVGAARRLPRLMMQWCVAVCL